MTFVRFNILEKWSLFWEVVPIARLSKFKVSLYVEYKVIQIILVIL